MPIPHEGYPVQDGGAVRILFPNFNVDLSCDNETELENCIEMLKKGLELFEIEKAKRLLLEQAQQEKIEEVMLKKPTITPQTYTTTGTATDLRKNNFIGSTSA